MHYDLLVLSPHADDAAFSIGGLVAHAARTGQKVALQTVYRSDDWNQLGIATSRATEDAAFAQRFGLTLLPPLLDEAPLRDRRYRSGRRLFDWIDPHHADIDKLVDHFRTLDCAAILAPLGVGEHVDHQLVHWAARRLETPVTFYEDSPYALMPGHVARRLVNLGAASGPVPLGPAMRAWSETPLLQRFGPFVRPFVAWTFCRSLRRREQPEALRWSASEVASSIEDRMDAIGCYPSQWPLFFARLQDWRKRLDRPERLHAPFRAAPFRAAADER